jgi:hypothetical protein
MSAGSRLRHEARDLIELVVLPSLAAVLPWRLCFRLFHLLCRWEWLYREECEEAARQAEAFGWIGGDRRRWMRARRLVTLVDHADFYLARSRSDRWLSRHVDVDGQWPAADRAGVLCTFHWGAGMWGLRHAGAQAMKAHAIVAPLSRELFPGRTVRFLYYQARNRSVADALRTQPIEPSHAPRRILRLLNAGEQIMAAIDVPSDQVAASESIEFLGRRAKVPRGLLRVAVESRIPVTIYITGIRLQDGRRTLAIRTLGVRADLAELTREVFGHLEQRVRAEPAAWHFWSVAPRFFGQQEQ